MSQSASNKLFEISLKKYYINNYLIGMGGGMGGGMMGGKKFMNKASFQR